MLHEQARQKMFHVLANVSRRGTLSWWKWESAGKREWVGWNEDGGREHRWHDTVAPPVRLPPGSAVSDVGRRVAHKNDPPHPARNSPDKNYTTRKGVALTLLPLKMSFFVGISCLCCLYVQLCSFSVILQAIFHIVCFLFLHLHPFLSALRSCQRDVYYNYISLKNNGIAVARSLYLFLLLLNQRKRL